MEMVLQSGRQGSCYPSESLFWKKPQLHISDFLTSHHEALQQLKDSIFRCIMPTVFYLQLNRGSFVSKHNYLMLVEE